MSANADSNWLKKITARRDLVLAALLVLIIFMMILPLPTWFVDLLIALNMSLSVILLMVAIYLGSVVGFTTLPSVLLVATLFRLSLSITTTRLILLDADAGSIVDTFGNVVIQGNLVVGLVVFLIITIVQFVVITKGSERVAEVAARFTLDSLPGKQISIDGDLRSGSIELAEAKRRRGILEKESQLYGAMDGAMKFVKGDAIAGLIIIAVNLLGGITIGTVQNNLEFGEAMQIYSVLTIGDGLVSQIPALFLSIAAGAIVTRVSSDDSSDLGSEISTQIFGDHRALQVTSLVLLGFAAVPGFPVWIFLILAALAGLSGFYFSRPKPEQAEEDSGYWSEGIEELPAAHVHSSTPVTLRLAENIADKVQAQVINRRLYTLREQFQQEMGLPFPKFSIRFAAALNDDQIEVLIDHVPAPQPFSSLRHNQLLVATTATHLQQLNIAHEAASSINERLQWVEPGAQSSLENAQLKGHDCTGQIIYFLQTILYKHASAFIGIQETKALLDEQAKSQADLVNEAQQVVSVLKINEIMKRLVSEGVSIRHLRIILECIADWGQREKDPLALTEHVRQALKRQICYKLSNGHDQLPVLLLQPNAEETIRNSVRQTSSGTFLALDPSYAQKLAEEIQGHMRQSNGDPAFPALLTSVDVRPHLHTMLRQEKLDYPVLSRSELTTEIQINPLNYVGE